MRSKNINASGRSKPRTKPTIESEAPLGKSTRRRSTVTFDDQDYEDAPSSNTLGQEDAVNDDEDEMGDMLDLLQKLQKKQTSKTSSRNSTLISRKNALAKTAFDKAESIKTEAITHIENCRAALQELQAQEMSSDDLLPEVYQLFSDRVTCVENILAAYQPILTHFRDSESQILEHVHKTFESHGQKREATRKKLMKKAKTEVLEGIEQQKLATDASAYIKEFRKLVLL